MRAWLLRRSAGALLCGAMGAGALYAADRDAFDACARWTRCARTTAVVVGDYSWALWGLDGDARTTAMAEAHHRNAARLRALFFRNRGLYLKVGQHLGMMDYMVPNAYVQAMRACYDDTPCSSLEDVRAVFQEDFGHTPDELFAEFSDTPIASASLAQVHVARLRDGRKVAVKVQHRALRRMAAGEITAAEALLRAVRLVWPDFGFQWLVAEMRLNLPQELDFLHEADNADRCRELCRPFAPHVVVPAVHRDLSSPRVLTMDFEEGSSLADVETIRRLGLDPRQVVRQLTEVFAEMVFTHGFVHCDPHPGNVLIRPTPGQDRVPQLVLLDHGLYRAVPQELRLQYCSLWKSIVLADVAGIKAASDAMGIRSPWMDQKFPGMDVAYRMIAAMLTAKEWPQIAEGADLGRFDSDKPAEEEKAQLSANVAEYLRGILDVLDTCPRELLLLLKTNDALRSAAGRLGGRSADTFVVTAKCCIWALWRQSDRRGIWDEARFRLSLLVALLRCQLFQWLQDGRDAWRARYGRRWRTAW
eukprot:EG_transcript_6355